MEEYFLFTIIWPGQQIFKKNESFPKKNYVFEYFKTEKGKKFVWKLPNGFFFPGPTKIQKIL
jgi:hypothetical protein